MQGVSGTFKIKTREQTSDLNYVPVIVTLTLHIIRYMHMCLCGCYQKTPRSSCICPSHLHGLQLMPYYVCRRAMPLRSLQRGLPGWAVDAAQRRQGPRHMGCVVVEGWVTPAITYTQKSTSASLAQVSRGL